MDLRGFSRERRMNSLPFFSVADFAQYFWNYSLLLTAVNYCLHERSFHAVFSIQVHPLLRVNVPPVGETIFHATPRVSIQHVPAEVITFL